LQNVHTKVSFFQLHEKLTASVLVGATASEKAKANSHTEEAIKHLEQAIDEGKMGHADVATTHAEAALTHLEQVK
jgi:Small metal-binding protein